MAFLSQQEHVSDGTLQSVSFSIAFLDKAHLHFYIGNDEVTSTVPVGGVLVQEVTNYAVTLTSPVPNGIVLSVRRVTPRTSVPHKFNNGAALFNAVNTDENNTYTLFIVQEVYEQSGNGPFPNITTLDGTELLYVNVGGVRKQITVSNFLDQTPDVVLDGFKQDLANNTDPAKGAGLSGYKGGTVFDRLSLEVWVTDAPFNAAMDGTTNDSPAFQAAYDYVVVNGGGVIHIPTGKTKLNAVINCTNSTVPVTFRGCGMQNINTGTVNGTVLLANTNGNAVFDIAGRHNFGLEDLTITSQDAVATPTPSRVGVLGARTVISPDNQNHHFTNVSIWLRSSGNPALPTIAHYAYGTELGCYQNGWYFADIPAVYTSTPQYSVTSSNTTLLTGSQSATCNSFDAMHYITVSGYGPQVHLDGTYDNSFRRSYFLNETSYYTPDRTHATVKLTGANTALTILDFQAEGNSTFLDIEGNLFNCDFKGFALGEVPGEPLYRLLNFQFIENCGFRVTEGINDVSPHTRVSGTGVSASQITGTTFDLGAYGNFDVTVGASGNGFKNIEFLSRGIYTPVIKCTGGDGYATYSLNGVQSKQGYNCASALDNIKTEQANATNINFLTVEIPNLDFVSECLIDYQLNTSSKSRTIVGQLRVGISRVAGGATVFDVSQPRTQAAMLAAGAETITLNFGVAGPFDPVTGQQYAFVYYNANSSTGGLSTFVASAKWNQSALDGSKRVDGQLIKFSRA